MPAPGNSAKVFFQSLLFIIVCAFFLAALRANSDLADGRYALFMDERLTFDGVRRILHAEDWNAFWWALADGGNQIYGRSLWNSAALASVLPEKLWGAAGQIVAARMLQAGLLLAAALVFALGLLRSWPLRCALLAALLTLPYSDYYATMPKPEPLQLLCLALFSVCALRRRFQFGSHWIFLGLAFGAKIAVLPAVLVFAAVALFAGYKTRRGREVFEQATAAALAFFAGFALSVPLFLEPFLLAAAVYVLLRFLRAQFRIGIAAQSALVAAGLGVLALEYRPVIESWVVNTFLATAHGSDQAAITPWNWMEYFFRDWLRAPIALATGACLAAAAFVAFNVADLRRQEGDAFHRQALGLILVAAGSAWMLAIFLAAHRLWGFYLHPGMALVIVGLLVLADVRKFAGAVAVAMLAFAAVFWAPRTFISFDALAQRTRSADYLAQRASYDAVTAFLDRHAAASARKLRVVYDPALFAPESNARYRIVEFFWPYTRWDDSPDVIVFGRKHTPAGEPVPPDSPAYPAFRAEREGYAKHVVGKSDPCPAARCYRREMTLPAGGEVLVLSN